jgi:uncharacterized membrane protein
MKEWLTVITENAVIIIDAMALVLIVVGTVEAFFAGLRIMLSSATDGHRQRDVWLRLARWLVAGLTFQLAADVIETAVAPSWDDIGKLGAIAVIRTFLNFFLERDLEDVRDRQHGSPPESTAGR